MIESDQRLRPQSALIRQSSWSGLSESSSHESLTGPLVKSSSLNSMKTSANSKIRIFFCITYTHPCSSSLLLFFLLFYIFIPGLVAIFSLSFLSRSVSQRSNSVRRQHFITLRLTAAVTPSPVNLL